MKITLQTQIRPDSRRCEFVRIAMIMLSIALTVTAACAPSATDPIWKLQLRIRVADVANAGTDADISVFLPVMNGTNSATYLDTVNDDFERNSNKTFHLLHSGVRTFSDIQMLMIRHNNTDAICLRELELMVNGVPVYAIDYGASGKWLENSILQITGAVIRNSSKWQNYVTPALSERMAANTVLNRINAALGHGAFMSAIPKFSTWATMLTKENWDAYRSQPQNESYRLSGMRYPKEFYEPVLPTDSSRMIVRLPNSFSGSPGLPCAVFDLKWGVAQNRLTITCNGIRGYWINTGISYDTFAGNMSTASIDAHFRKVFGTWSSGENGTRLFYTLLVRSFYNCGSLEFGLEAGDGVNGFHSMTFPILSGKTRVEQTVIDNEGWFLFR